MLEFAAGSMFSVCYWLLY